MMNSGESVSNIRRDYSRFKLDDNSIKKNPIEQFDIWINEAIEASFPDPNAMTLATATKDGKPSARVVLLKGYDEKGFRFYTNYESRKGLEIEENPNVSLLFYWDEFERQVRIDGKAEKLSQEESFKYFNSRPYVSRIGAWASRQSQPLKSRFSLIREVAKLTMRYPKNVPLPPFWGGYIVIPEAMEFWQGRDSRLHDRFLYERNGGEWKITRLSP